MLHNKKLIAAAALALCIRAASTTGAPAAWAPEVGGIEGSYFRGRH